MTKPKITAESHPALHLIDHVWEHIQESCGHSWQRLNWAMYDAVQLAIKAGMRFEPCDFEHIAANYRPGYWMGETMGEGLYGDAVSAGTLSACKSFEQWKERPAFIIAGRRICVGSELTGFFDWRAPRPVDTPEWMDFPGAKVSTFRDDKESFIVLSNWNAKKHQWKRGGAPCRRWTVTRDDISAANKSHKESRKKPEPEAASA